MVDAERCAGVVSTAATLVVHCVVELVVGHQGGVQNLVVVGPRSDSVDGCCHRCFAEEVVGMLVERGLEAVRLW